MTSSAKKPQVIVAQLGARMHYAVPVLLHRAGMLAHFFTDAYVGPGSAWHWLTKVAPLLPTAWQPPSLPHLLYRRADGLPADKVTAFNLLGYQYARALAGASDFTTCAHIHQKYGDRFAQLVLHQIHHNGLHGDAIYVFQGAALPLLRGAQARGWRSFFEQFSAPARVMYKLYQEEHQLYPDWEVSDIDYETVSETIEREQACWHWSDHLICASEFVRRGLVSQGAAPEKIQVIPYGVDIQRYARPRTPWDGRRPLRLLFVGGVTVRKGVQYLYEALKLLNHSRLEARLVGPVAVSPPARRQLAQVAELIGQVPRGEVHLHYDWADIFLFPTICDGFGVVQIEALAAGLPVITTFNAGSVVRDGMEGFIVPIRDPETLAARIDQLAREPALLAQMSRNARERGREFSWEKYGNTLVKEIERCIT